MSEGCCSLRVTARHTRMVRLAYLEFRNRGSSPVVINTALNTFGDCGLSFEVTGPSGRSIPQNFIFPSRRLSPYGPKDFRKLDSGKVFRMEIRVDNWFQLDEPGQYSVRVSYWNRYEGRWFDQAVWTGTTPKSPVTTLRIH